MTSDALAPNTHPPGRRSRRSRIEAILDRVFGIGTGLASLAVVFLLGAITILLARGAYPTLVQFGPSLFLRSAWDVSVSPPVFGLWPEIYGTLITSAIALLLGVPVSLGIAMFLSEDAPRVLRTPLAALVELLAAIPSVVYGLWGLVVLAPQMRTSVEPGLQGTLGQVPGLSVVFAGTPLGTDILTAGVILAIMIIPTVSAISREAMQAVPRSQREAALALGATRWETTRTSVFPYAASGIFGAVILGLGRALGETMAVTMTIGNNPYVASSSLFGQGQTLASNIANSFGEAADARVVGALLAAGLILLIITLLVNVIARLLVRRVYRAGEAAG